MSDEIIALNVMHSDATQHPDEFENKAFGFWVYLMTDLVLFAALFATFAVMSHSYAGGPGGKTLFDLPGVFAETMFLLFSSATYGLVMVSMHSGRKKLVLGWLFVTFLLGLGFITMEITEFHHMIMDGNGPADSFQPSLPWWEPTGRM